MLSTLALLCICIACLVSSGPVGKRLCHVLCDKDCSCSSLSFNSRQMICEFLSYRTLPSKRDVSTCTAGSCGAVHTRRGAVLCLDRHNNLVRYRNVSVKCSPRLETPLKDKRREKARHRFRLHNGKKETFLSGKGLDVEAIELIVAELDRFIFLSMTFLTSDHCTFKIYISYLNVIKELIVRVETSETKLLKKQIFRRISRTAYVCLTWTTQEVRFCLRHPHKTSPSLITEVIQTNMKWTDLSVRGGSPNGFIVEVFTKPDK